MGLELQAIGQLQGAEVTLLVTSHASPRLSVHSLWVGPVPKGAPSLTHSAQWKAGIHPQLQHPLGSQLHRTLDLEWSQEL